MFVKYSKISKLSSLALAALLVVGISPAFASGSHEIKNSNVHAATMPIGTAGKADDVSRTIQISMKDNFFSPENIQIKEGETIRFIIKNEGELVHEFSIGTAAMHAAHQQEMSAMVEHGALELDKINQVMMKMDMGDGNTMEHKDPNSALIEPSKTAEIIWKFSKNSKLEIACNVPGHYQSGMIGRVQFN
ncbi:MAG: cupredoxin domain-containing protein [Sneathiella sp.]